MRRNLALQVDHATLLEAKPPVEQKTRFVAHLDAPGEGWLSRRLFRLTVSPDRSSGNLSVPNMLTTAGLAWTPIRMTSFRPPGMFSSACVMASAAVAFALRVVRAGDGRACNGHARVPDGLDLLDPVTPRDLVESDEHGLEHVDDLGRVDRRRERREPHDVGEDDVHRVEPIGDHALTGRHPLDDGRREHVRQKLLGPLPDAAGVGRLEHRIARVATSGAMRSRLSVRVSISSMPTRVSP